MKNLWAILFAAICSSAPLFAHHALPGDQYDKDTIVKLTGVVTKVQWTNPHAWIYLEVKDEKGNVVEWRTEMRSPGGMVKEGLDKSSVPVGAQVTVGVWVAKFTPNGPAKYGAARTLTLPDGKTIDVSDIFAQNDRNLKPGQAVPKPAR